MDKIISVSRIRKYFDIESKILRRRIGKTTAVDGVSFQIARAETLGLVGESGSGKTTIAKIITGLMRADAGEVFVDNVPVVLYRRRDLAQKIQMIFQDPFSSLNPRLSVRTMLGESVISRIRNREKKRPARSTVEKEISELLSTVGIASNAADNYPHQFSGGQRQRIAIARALAFKPELIIADEPLSSLDVSIQAQILNLFSELKERFGLSYLFISHDLMLVSYFSDRVIVLKNGKIAEEAQADRIMTAPVNEYTKKLVSSIL